MQQRSRRSSPTATRPIHRTINVPITNAISFYDLCSYSNGDGGGRQLDNGTPHPRSCRRSAICPPQFSAHCRRVGVVVHDSAHLPRSRVPLLYAARLRAPQRLRTADVRCVWGDCGSDWALHSPRISERYSTKKKKLCPGRDCVVLVEDDLSSAGGVMRVYLARMGHSRGPAPLRRRHQLFPLIDRASGDIDGDATATGNQFVRFFVAQCRVLGMAARWRSRRSRTTLSAPGNCRGSYRRVGRRRLRGRSLHKAGGRPVLCAGTSARRRITRAHVSCVPGRSADGRRAAADGNLGAQGLGDQKGWCTGVFSQGNHWGT